MAIRPAGANGLEHRHDTWLGRVSDRFGLVLCMLVATFMVLAAGFTSDWMLPVTVALLGGTFLAVLAAAGVRLRTQRRARLFAGLCVVAALASLPGIGTWARVCVAVLCGLLAAACPVIIARSIMRRGIVDVRTVLGALCIYVLLGLCFAFVYTVIGLAAGRFFVQQATARSSDYVYFSYVTLTTVGYGDLTASDGVGRALAIFEALIGQIYLVTVVAVLVSNLGPARRRELEERRSEAASGD
ncbi:MAG TPA: potassium channel family protein [Acidimicrobiia bacterium]|jgi:hypothetical protein